MKIRDIVTEASLGSYVTKATKDKALNQMSAFLGSSPEERAMGKEKARRREQGLARVKHRSDNIKKANQAKQLADLVARLPELKTEYAAMKSKYSALGGSNWQYADREQNLTDAERQARSLEGTLQNLWRQIQTAEKAQGEQGIKESKMGEVDLIFQELANGNMDIYNTMTNPEGPEEEYVAKQLQDMYSDISSEHRLHPDDQFEEIIDIIHQRLADDFGTDEF